MSISIQTMSIVNGAIYAVKEILPEQAMIHSPSAFTHTQVQLNYSVLVNLIGDLQAKIIINGDQSFFSNLCNSLYGFQLADDMLDSFVGEFGNMVAGKLCSYNSTQQINLDITPPIVTNEPSYLQIDSRAFSLPITLTSIGDFNIFLSIK